MDIRKQINEALREKGLSRRAAAKAAKMKPSTLCAFLNREQGIQTSTLARIMAVAGLAEGTDPCEHAPPTSQSPSASNSNCP